MSTEETWTKKEKRSALIDKFSAVTAMSSGPFKRKVGL